MKREREDDGAASTSSDDIAQHLNTLASAVNAGNERLPEAQAADQRAREALIQKMLTMPPKECFSPAALAAFKQKHIAMMQRGTAQPTKSPPPGAVLPPAGAAGALPRPAVAPPAAPPMPTFSVPRPGGAPGAGPSAS